MIFFLLLILFSNANGIFITCNFRITSWQAIGDHLYACEVTSVDLSLSSTHITGYTGNHLSGYSSDDVELISFRCQLLSSQIRTVPKGFLNIFKNFTAIFFQTCPILFFYGDELFEYPNLLGYGHTHSNLAEIPKDFFAFTPNLIVVDFGANRIEFVAEGLLDELKNLNQAWFDRNICINSWAFTRSEIPALIENLRQNCTPPSLKTTTSTSTSISPTTSTLNL
jgi:hypothetical protein